jgi:hypothetical protein
LSDARTPTAHASTHFTGGSDALTATNIGAAEASIEIIAGTALTGGGTLEADRTLNVLIGTTSGAVASGDRGLPTGGTTAQVLVKDSGSDYDTSWSSVPVKDAQAFQAFFPATGESGRTTTTGYSYPHMSGGGGAAVARNNNRLYIQTFNIGAQIKLDRARISVSTQAASADQTARLGIYSNDENMVPTTLIDDFGTVDISSTGIKAITGIDLDLTAGSYSLVYVLEQNCSLRRSTHTAPQLGGMWSDSDDSNNRVRPYASLTYAALPSTFPSPITAEANASSTLDVYIQVGWSLL